jgi:cardiolipin synthase A/B
MRGLLIAYFATWIVIPWIFLAKKRPESTLAWLWAVLLFPFLGPIAYLLFGVDRVTRSRRRAHKPYHRDSAKRDPAPSPRHTQLFRALARLSEIPTSTARDVRILANATHFYPALEQRIRDARHHVHIEFFIWANDRYGCQFRDLLVEAAQRGVEVRLLLDRMGSKKVKGEFFEPLRKAGGHIAWFRSINPLRRRFSLHLRNHRKIQIIDGQIGFVGGMNLGKEYMGQNPDLGHWRDIQVEFAGHVVTELQHVFAEDWHYAAEEVLEGPSYFPIPAEPDTDPAQIILGGPDLPAEPMAEAMIAVLNHAKERAWITTGYFAPDARLHSALRLAAVRGVDVRMINTEKSDHPYLAHIAQSYYEELLSAGVRIFEYRPGIYHGKAFLVDDLLMIGSANCDDRSMRLNFELNILIESAQGADALASILSQDLAESGEIDFEAFKKRSLKRRLLEALLRPIGPLT